MREEVYSQARAAMIRQLWSFDPPLAEDEIDHRVGQFDAAVERIESDLVAAFAAAPALRSKPARPASARVVAVVEGYDEEADYAPAFGGRSEGHAADDEVDDGYPAAGEDEYQADAPSDPFPTIEDLERAIQAALRSEDDAATTQAPDLADIEAPSVDSDDDEHDGYDPRAEDFPLRDSEPQYDYDDRAVADAYAGGGDDAGEDQRASRAPAWWQRVNDGDRVRILLVAIAALGVVLVALAAYVVVPRFASEDEASGVAEQPVRRVVSDAAAAERIPTEPADIVQSFTIFDGSDPTVFEGSPGNPVRFDRDGDGSFARVNSSAATAGARVVIGPGIAGRLAGHHVRVTLVARSARNNGAAGMRFAYQSGVAISHWQKARLGTGYAALGLLWRVPAIRTDPAGDYLLIEPGIPGDTTGVEIQSVKIELLAP